MQRMDLTFFFFTFNIVFYTGVIGIGIENILSNKYFRKSYFC